MFENHKFLHSHTQFNNPQDRTAGGVILFWSYRRAIHWEDLHPSPQDGHVSNAAPPTDDVEPIESEMHKRWIPTD